MASLVGLGPDRRDAPRDQTAVIHRSDQLNGTLQGWLGLLDFDTTQWSSYASVKDWWCSISGTNGRRRHGLSSLLLLAAWEIWNERNARVFRNVASMPISVIDIIKSNAALWGAAGVKHLCNIMPRE